jgi:hypothetical protein
MKIPVFLPVTREFGFRDEFAQDCLLQRGVCKLSVPEGGLPLGYGPTQRVRGDVGSIPRF